MLIRQDPYMGNDVLRGVRAGFTNDRRWVFFLRSNCDTPTIRWVLRNCHGVIVYPSEEPWYRRLRASGLPSVCLFAPPGKRQHLPTVTQDNLAVGQQAAEHLLQRGHRHFAFVGSSWQPSSLERQRGFCDRLARDGHACRVHIPPHTDEPEVVLNALARFVADLPRPVGVCAATDSLGVQVLDVSHRVGITVPHELAVVGVGNRVNLCNLGSPPLSSVEVPFERIGYRAAILLRKLITGKPAPKQPLLIAPRGVVARQSSEAWAVSDELVSRALRFISDHACDPVSVTDVADHAGCSYHLLLKRFDQAISRTPYQEIRRVQIDRAKRLLDDTDWPVHRVARACGWRDSKQIGRVFRQVVGLSPGAFRRNRRLG